MATTITKYITKYCTLCKQEDKEHTLGSTSCRDCRKQYHKQYRESRKKDDYYSKVCYKCKEEKTHSPAGTWCVDCALKYTLENKEKTLTNGKLYRKNNKEKIAQKIEILKQKGIMADRQRRAKLKQKYKLSLEDYDKMLESQNNVCAICGNNDPQSAGRKNLFIDHCHKTNDVRGILCSKCNSGLGFFKDSTLFLANAIKYLDNYKNKSI